ncbi:UNKNOWN [Stylonychia lemnae]|uniref:Uncharacterized protein n=1 Tax=Stylonychia lemnae TaxID=5949 RepID=A0A078B4W9_STYLE|nr:UNKNOWN [Stylonychia lemnae]|eukprot:CDW88272.1 UNKNOWN [Stylonychia lemnae]
MAIRTQQNSIERVLVDNKVMPVNTGKINVNILGLVQELETTLKQASDTSPHLLVPNSLHIIQGQKIQKEMIKSKNNSGITSHYNIDSITEMSELTDTLGNELLQQNNGSSDENQTDMFQSSIQHSCSDSQYSSSASQSPRSTFRRKTHLNYNSLLKITGNRKLISKGNSGLSINSNKSIILNSQCDLPIQNFKPIQNKNLLRVTSSYGNNLSTGDTQLNIISSNTCLHQSIQSANTLRRQNNYYSYNINSHDQQDPNERQYSNYNNSNQGSAHDQQKRPKSQIKLYVQKYFERQDRIRRIDQLLDQEIESSINLNNVYEKSETFDHTKYQVMDSASKHENMQQRNTQTGINKIQTLEKQFNSENVDFHQREIRSQSRMRIKQGFQMISSSSHHLKKL